MQTISKLAPLALALAICLHAGVARAQTDAEPTQIPETKSESIPGVIVLPPRRRMPLPAAGQPDGETCPANELKKLELIG